MQSPWSIQNPNGDDPQEEAILKPVCFVFDFAPTRALRLLSDYGIGLSPNEPNPERVVIHNQSKRRVVTQHMFGSARFDIESRTIHAQG